MRESIQHHTTIKIRSEFRNVSDPAYAMSHLTAEACTQWLAAGHGSACSSNRCRLTQRERGTGSGPFVRSLRAGAQPILDSSAQAVNRPSAHVHGERKGIGWCMRCVRNVRER